MWKLFNYSVTIPTVLFVPSDDIDVDCVKNETANRSMYQSKINKKMSSLKNHFGVKTASNAFNSRLKKCFIY